MLIIDSLCKTACKAGNCEGANPFCTSKRLHSDFEARRVGCQRGA